VLPATKHLLILFLFASFCGTALAETQPPRYFGLFGGDARIKPDEGGRGATNNFNFKFGRAFSDFWGVEAHLGKDFSRERSVGKDGVRYVAVLARGNLPLERINVYGLAGVTSVDADVANINGAYTGPALGIGIELFGSYRTAVGLEFMQYGVEDRYSTVSLGVVHHFEWPRFR